MALIVKTNLLKDLRPINGYGMVIAEHLFDDGQVWPVVMQIHSSVNVLTKLGQMKTERETLRAIHEAGEQEQQLIAQIEQKTDEYIKALPDADKEKFLTPEELQKLKEIEAASADQIAVVK